MNIATVQASISLQHLYIGTGDIAEERSSILDRIEARVLSESPASPEAESQKLPRKPAQERKIKAARRSRRSDYAPADYYRAAR